MRRLSGLVFLVLMGLVVPGRATTWFVRSGGSDTADGKTAPTAFKTLTRAAAMFDHGDSLVIGPGTYRESVLVADRFSADGAQMAITGDESGRQTGGAAGPVVLIPATPTQSALALSRVRNLAVSGLTFRGPGQGLKLEKCHQVAVARCSFDGLARGLAIAASRQVSVTSAVFARNTIALFCQGSSDTALDHLTLAGSTSVGILALNCGPGTIRNSILTGNNTNLIGDNVSEGNWTSDYNVITGTCGVWGDVPAVAKIHEWTAASGLERHSVFVAPAFVNPDNYDLHPDPQVTWPGGLPGMNIGQMQPQLQSKPGQTSLLDRDGKPFRTRGTAVGAGAYDYPDPRPAAGWKKLAVKFEGTGPRQSAAVYLPDDTLVRSLVADAAGLTELYWDGLDDLGKPVPAGNYVAKVLTHDVRLVDDGSFGDNGNPLGAYNCDNANRVVGLPDGGFIITTIYDEGQYPLRRYSASGQSTYATGFSDGDFSALARRDDDLYAIVGKGEGTRLIHLVLPGERVKMANGAEGFPVLNANEKDAAVMGLAVVGDDAFVSVSGPNLSVVRVVDLKTGARKADWPVAAVGDLAADGKDQLWVISGKEIQHLTPAGARAAHFDTGLPTPRYLAAGVDRLAVIDGEAGKVAILDGAGHILRTMGQPRQVGEFTPVSVEAWRDPRGAAFLSDGRLAVTEHNRVRIIMPETGRISQEILSNFMDNAVPHPQKPEYVYCYMGVFHVDAKTGAWEWLVEEPMGMTQTDREGKVKPLSYGSPSTSVVLQGRPFIVYVSGAGGMRMLDVSDPLKPRMAFLGQNQYLAPGAYSTLGFAKDGSIIASTGGSKGYSLFFNRIAFKGLDAAHNPQFDFDHVQKLGQDTEDSARKMLCNGSVTVDRSNDDIYIGAVTDLYHKMVPAWGADATGVGRVSATGKPLWFALSSGGNYMSVGAQNDGKNTFIMAAKSFGGQIDLFDADGLRLTTGNWSWPCAWNMGFVDMRYGLNAYLRPDGKVGAYVEDDAIGRFVRCRVDGADTMRKTTTPLAWQGGAEAGTPPDVEQVQGKGLEKIQLIPKVAPLPVDGDWTAWAKAGVVPQIVTLPALSYKHGAVPDDLWQSFNIGTAIGAVAHDGQNFYLYFLVTDSNQRFDTDNPGMMWAYDSVELWMEEEQFGLGLTSDSKPHLFKYRYHNLEGKEWSANYGLPPANVWGMKVDDLSRHPLGRQLSDITGVSFAGKKGYVVMGKIPFPEVKLVGGIAGRNGITDIKPGAPEIVRIGVNFGGVTSWGHSQDYKAGWPSSIMYSDPTRSANFVLGQ